MYEEHNEAVVSCIREAVDRRGMASLGVEIFERFFDVFPEAKDYFADSDIPTFAPRKYQIIQDFFVDTVAHPDFAEVHVSCEVERHLMYGIKDPDYYLAIIDAFQAVILSSCENVSDEKLMLWNEVAEGMKAHIKLGADLYL